MKFKLLYNSYNMFSYLLKLWGIRFFTLVHHDIMISLFHYFCFFNWFNYIEIFTQNWNNWSINAIQIQFSSKLEDYWAKYMTLKFKMYDLKLNNLFLFIYFFHIYLLNSLIIAIQYYKTSNYTFLKIFPSQCCDLLHQCSCQFLTKLFTK